VTPELYVTVRVGREVVLMEVEKEHGVVAEHAVRGASKFES
jgi:hypothetical protein